MHRKPFIKKIGINSSFFFFAIIYTIFGNNSFLKLNLTHQVITVPGTLELPDQPGDRCTNRVSQQRAQRMGSAWQSHIRGDKVMCCQSIYIIGRQESNNNSGPLGWPVARTLWADITSYQPRKVLSSLYWEEEAGSSMCNSSTNSGGWNHSSVLNGSERNRLGYASSPSQQNPRWLVWQYHDH